MTLVTAVLASACFADVLHVGDKAPVLKADRWMKGTPVTNFEKGNVYVIEFWATWCGPCRVAMPHLSELAKKYAGKATFVGVDIWEDQHASPGEDLKAKADKFVKEMGDRMGYNVCAGSDDGFMAQYWMAAAGQEGIPATFVIGKDGNIAWIGHPYYLDEPLGKIIDGTFDEAAFAAKQNAEIDKTRKEADLGAKIMKPIEDAIKASDFKQAIDECDKALKTTPDTYKYGIAMRKYELLAKHFPDRAFAEAQKYESDPAQSWMASEVFGMTSDLPKDCYNYAFKFFEKKYKDQPNNPNGFAHYASVYYQLGEYQKAVDNFKIYAERMKKENLDPETISFIDKQLQKYQDALKTGKPQP